MKLKPES